MKSFRATALRLMFPLLFRWATFDFLGTDDFVEVLLGFDDVLFERFAEDEERIDERELDELREPFWAIVAKGNSNAMNVSRAMRLSVENPLSRADEQANYRPVLISRQAKRTHDSRLHHQLTFLCDARIETNPNVRVEPRNRGSLLLLCLLRIRVGLRSPDR